jgi:hypothetical protein
MAIPIGRTPRSGIGTSVPTKVRERIDEIAIGRGCSRSALVSEVLSEFIAKCDSARKKRETRSP